MHSYRVFNEADFASLTNVIADPNHQLIYALSGNSIFAIQARSQPRRRLSVGYPASRTAL